MARKKKVRIEERCLGREGAYGLCYVGQDLIEIDPRLNSRHYLTVLVHELLHHAFPEMSETEVTRKAPRIASGIWQQRYRRLSE